jgi:hypothetical protein
MAQLRASYLAIVENEGYSQTIIRSIPIGDSEGLQGLEALGGSGGGGGGDFVLESPPIEFNVGRHVRKVNLQTRNRIRGRKTGSTTKKRPDNLEKLAEFKEFDDVPVIEQPLQEMKKRKSIITTPNIVKFFKRDDSDSDDSSKTAIIQSNNLELIHEEDKSDDDITEQEEFDKAKSKNLAYSIDSDFGVPVSKETGKILTGPLDFFLEQTGPNPGTNKDNDIDNNDREEQDEYDDFDDDDDDIVVDNEDDDSEVDFSEESSLGSEISNTEDEFLLDNSIILSSYGNIFSENPPSYTNKKSRSKRAGSNSLDTFSRIPSTNTLRQPSLSQSSIDSSTNKATVPIVKSMTSLKKNTITFDKINPISEVKPSVLSSLINSKSRFNNSNPLFYYQFVDGEVTDPKSRSVDITIFYKEKVVLQDLKLNNNALIVDCIGFILLNLTKMADYKGLSMNPNHWRLELTDEDCDDYGEFGYLNRTRVLSSYNNPKYFKLNEVSEGQRKSNEKQTPLPTEFKSNLDRFSQKRNSFKFNTSKFSNEMVELLITVDHPREEFVYHAALNTTIGRVLEEIRLKEGFNRGKYVFKELKDHIDKDGLIHTKKSPILLESTIIADLICRSLLMTQSIQSLVPENITYDAKLSFQAQITPSEFTLPATEFGNRATKETNEVDNSNEINNNKLSLLIVERGKREVMNAKQLEDLMQGKNTDLPTSLTLMYYKWRVWRKKPAILNKLERFFIIDGDYIWLTPPDEISNISNYGTLDNAGDSHHHHHLRFNNYYKTLLTKTNQFHITQIVKVKQYKKHPAHFRIVVSKQSDSNTQIQKKYYLDAESSEKCHDIIEKLHWTEKLYNLSIINGS